MSTNKKAAIEMQPFLFSVGVISTFNHTSIRLQSQQTIGICYHLSFIANDPI